MAYNHKFFYLPQQVGIVIDRATKGVVPLHDIICFIGYEYICVGNQNSVSH